MDISAMYIAKDTKSSGKDDTARSISAIYIAKDTRAGQSDVVKRIISRSGFQSHAKA